jgi:hypothetical protein
MVRAAAGARTPVIGVGERAFPRMGPALLLEDYRVLCAMPTLDLGEFRALAGVDCLHEGSAAPEPACRDTLSILSHPALSARGCAPPAGSRLVIYRQSPALHGLARSMGWELLAAPTAVRARWEDKAWFRSRLAGSPFPALEGELVPADGLDPAAYRRWRRRWGPALVVQIPDFPRGGGRSTFFVNSAEELARLAVRLGAGRHRGHAVGSLLVSPLVTGPSLSMVGCVGPWGVLLSPLQTQLLDLPELLAPGREGRFCGHQWGAPAYPDHVERAAGDLCRWVGGALADEGYGGIFGVDFALDEDTQQLYALECNPRYTGALPTLTLLQAAAGHPPLEAFHLLALLGSPDAVAAEAVERSTRQFPAAAQLLLFHRGPEPGRVRGTLAPGRYVWPRGEAAPRRTGPLFPLPPPPWDDGEFMVLDGPPPPGAALLPGEALDRVVRLLFFRHVMNEGGALDPEVAAVVRWAYASLGLDEEQARRS